ncbi:hypothetical protein GCM10020220_095600 [Nonomuraea rubra]
MPASRSSIVFKRDVQSRMWPLRWVFAAHRLQGDSPRPRQEARPHPRRRRLAHPWPRPAQPPLRPHRRGTAWHQALADLGAAGKHTRPYRPQTNGKAERFNRPLLDEWAYAQPYDSNNERTTALPDFPHTYTHHRCHTTLGVRPPITRVNNPAGQYT